MFKDQINFLLNFENVLHTQFKNTIEEHNLILKEFLIEEQLFQKGVDGNNKSLGGYARTSISLKVSKGLPSDHVTLFDKGYFYANIEITATPQYFVISSNVSYDKWILRRYGRDVLKVTPDNMREFMQKFFLPNLKMKIDDGFRK